MNNKSLLIINLLVSLAVLVPLSVLGTDVKDSSPKPPDLSKNGERTKKGNYDIRTFGAIGDGKTLNTKAIQAAIDACHDQGGGNVVIASGTYLSGTIHLKSNVYLFLAPDGVLLGSVDTIKDYEKGYPCLYRGNEYLGRAFVFAKGQNNIGILGTGKIDGNSAQFKKLSKEAQKQLIEPGSNRPERPMMIKFLECSDIHIENVKLHDSLAWTTCFLYCEKIWIRGVDILDLNAAGGLPNGDGLDFCSCSDVFVSDCKIKATDDNLCIQTSAPDKTSQNFSISNCVFSGNCAGVRIGCLSWGDVRNVVVENCIFTDLKREGVKIESIEGHEFSKIVVRGAVMSNVYRPIFLLSANAHISTQSDQIQPFGTIRDVTISDVTIKDFDETNSLSPDYIKSRNWSGIKVDAPATNKIKGLTLKNIRYQTLGGIKAGDYPNTEYPIVRDARLRERKEKVSCYEPRWSRTSAVDIRSVDDLVIDNLDLHFIYKDERPEYIIENCEKSKCDIKIH